MHELENYRDNPKMCNWVVAENPAKRLIKSSSSEKLGKQTGNFSPPQIMVPQVLERFLGVQNNEFSMLVHSLLARRLR